MAVRTPYHDITTIEGQEPCQPRRRNGTFLEAQLSVPSFSTRLVGRSPSLTRSLGQPSTLQGSCPAQSRYSPSRAILLTDAIGSWLWQAVGDASVFSSKALIATSFATSVSGRHYPIVSLPRSNRGSLNLRTRHIGPNEIGPNETGLRAAYQLSEVEGLHELLT